ncbi:hypothetical protein ABE142_01330 [Paenibacillus alvei]
MYNNKLNLGHAEDKINTYDAPQPTGSIVKTKKELASPVLSDKNKF